MMYQKIFRSLSVLIVAAAILVVGLIVPQMTASQTQPNAGGVPTMTAGEFALPGTFWWAVVNGHLAVGANATVRGRGVVSSTRIATGQYQVIFQDNVRPCAYIATVGDIDAVGIEATGEITTVGRATDVRGVFLTTTTSAGAFADRSFHLLVHC